MADKLIKGALFSDCRKYRYRLYRRWDERPMVMFIGLNPSTANEVDDDHTIRRCIGFAKSWNAGGMYMMNLYAYVSTDPDKLLFSGEDIEENNKHLIYVASYCSMVVFAWGCFKQHKKRMDEVISMFPNAYCIEKSKNGYPKHPLYLRSSLKPIKF